MGKVEAACTARRVVRQVGGWMIGLFLIGLLPGINNWGHGGGLVAGIALGFLLGYRERIREQYFHKALAGVCVVATILVLGWVLLFGLGLRLGFARLV